VPAYSARQDEADPPRIATILGRQVPEHYTRLFRERGVFQQLYRSERPIWINPATSESDDVLPRVAVAVRAGDEVLGSIWVRDGAAAGHGRARLIVRQGDDTS
jgi:hypothetical protein